MTSKRASVGQSPARVPQRTRRAAYWTLSALWLTGVLWLVFHYFLYRQGEFGREPHALEIWWLRLHGAAAFLTLWLAGLMWATHVRPAWRLPRRRLSGVIVIGALMLLIATGYLLYYASDETLRDAVRLVHWVVGVALVVPFLIHVLGARAWRRRS